MNEKLVKAIEAALKNGDRVELIPTQDGIRLVRIRRENILKIQKRARP